MAMSGGVDSSVAALILQQEGYEVIGVTMKLFDGETADEDSSCCSLEDTEDAKQVALRLGIPHYTFNFKDAFEHAVIDKFCESYLQGLTPNPCIDCNRYLKFDRLQQRRRELDLDFVATGHYARRVWDKERGRYLLKTARDKSKDQSYVLYHLSQDQLAHMLFPLGELTKSEVRHLAADHGFSNAEKAESQDICFVPDGDYASFITRRCGTEISSLQPGPIVDTEGNILGTHQGVAHYTIGQRKGIGVAGPEPYFVCRKDAQTNELVIGTAKETAIEKITIGDVNLIAFDKISEPLQAQVKTHYRQQAQAASVRAIPGSDNLEIVFDQAQRGCAPGQAAVIYDGDTVIGGGTIL